MEVERDVGACWVRVVALVVRVARVVEMMGLVAGVLVVKTAVWEGWVKAVALGVGSV